MIHNTTAAPIFSFGLGTLIVQRNYIIKITCGTTTFPKFVSGTPICQTLVRINICYGSKEHIMNDLVS